jgi:hypothetical protein
MVWKWLRASSHYPESDERRASGSLGSACARVSEAPGSLGTRSLRSSRGWTADTSGRGPAEWAGDVDWRCGLAVQASLSPGAVAGLGW